MRSLIAALPLLCACERPEAAAPRSPGWNDPSWSYPVGSEPIAGYPPFPAAPGERAVAVAVRWQGIPYCWGGTGPHCYDCSGLTFAAWRAAGHLIPRTSDQQHDGLLSVPMDALVPGDILWRPGHVGLYVGRGWAIHAPGEGKTVQYQPASKFTSAHRPVW